MRPHRHPQDVYSLKQFDMGEPCVICQDTSHNIAPPGRAAEDRQERCVPATDRKPVSRVELGQRGPCVCFCLTLLSQDQPLVRRDEEVLDAPEDLFSEWEQRKKSRAGGGAPCESRKIVLCAPLLWQAILVTIRLQRGCWATLGRRRSRRALQVYVSCVKRVLTGRCQSGESHCDLQ